MFLLMFSSCFLLFKIFPLKSIQYFQQSGPTLSSRLFTHPPFILLHTSLKLCRIQTPVKHYTSTPLIRPRREVRVARDLAYKGKHLLLHLGRGEFLPPSVLLHCYSFLSSTNPYLPLRDTSCKSQMMMICIFVKKFLYIILFIKILMVLFIKFYL